MKKAGFITVAALVLIAAAAQSSVTSGVQKWRAGDWEGAVADWVQPAARGDADALFNLGQAYRLGRGVQANQPVAQDYYRRAAAKGHLGAIANLGITLYQDGRKTEALPYLREAADKGDVRASYVLGVATFTGDGAPRNPTLGYAYVIRARDGGLQPASAQAARYATMLSAGERARGEAAAAALAAGEPVPVELVGSAGVAPPQPARPATQMAAADEDAAEEDNGTTGATSQVTAPPPAAKPVVAEKPAAAKDKLAEKPADKTPAKEKAADKTTEKGRAADKSADKAADKGKSKDKEEAKEAPGYKVQLGAYGNEQAARTAWATLVANSGELLKGRKPVYSPKGRLIRLHIGPFKQQDDARELCQKLSAAGRPCFVTKE